MLAVQQFILRHRRDITIVLLLFIVAGIPRLTDLGTFLTADEKNWIGRSYEFFRAFTEFRFNDMMQTSHPGVTTMWASGITITAKMVLGHVPFSFRNLSHFVFAGQFPIALINTLAVPVMYIFLKKLFSRTDVAALAALFIALDPFIVGYSRVIHVDALLASFLFLAALATMIYAKEGYSRVWLVTSAIFSALAILTKIPGVFIVPFFILVVLAYEGKNMMHREVLRDRFRDVLTWMLLVTILFFIAWPAVLWVPNPKGNVLIVKRDILTAAATPHHMTEDYTLNAYHYPATLLSRTNPISLVFSIIAVGMIGYGFIRKDLQRDKLLLIGYIFFFLVMMTIGAKKGDRYILPVFPAIDVLAAIGIVGLGLIRSRIISLVTVIYFAVVIWNYHPYTIAYSNPLFPDNISQELGWGEGLEQVGAWLSQNNPDAVVASWYPEELGAYTSARVAHINAHEQGNVRFVVLYKNMFGRAPDHPANDFIDEYYKKREPVFVAHVAGKEFAWVYEKRVYERIVGELVPGFRVEQQLETSRDTFAGIDILVATYSGKATSGTLVVSLKDAVERNEIRRWRAPVQEINDNTWVSFMLPGNLESLPKDIVVEAFAEGTTAGDAPTIRYTRDFDYRKSQMIINGEKKDGDLAIRLRYNINGQPVSEDDSKLLPE